MAISPQSTHKTLRAHKRMLIYSDYLIKLTNYYDRTIMNTKVLHILVDGCRPDALQQANTPNIDRLWQSGAYTWTAQTVMPSVTLPSHNSMFRSVPPQKHGIGADNIFCESSRAFPSLIDVASLGNKHTCMFCSWEQLRDLSNPGSLKVKIGRAHV